MLDCSRYDSLCRGEPQAQDVVALVAQCLDRGAKVVVVKCGAVGRDGTRGAHSSHQLSRGQSLVGSPCFIPQPLVGACNVKAADALSGVRTWDGTARRVQAGWCRQLVALPVEWAPDTNRLWIPYPWYITRDLPFKERINGEKEPHS
jgi:hypothetical protein